MATQITTSWKKIKEVYVGNDGAHDVYWRMYAKISSQDTSNTVVAVEGRLYLSGSAGSMYSGPTTTVGGNIGTITTKWGIDAAGTYYPGETTKWSYTATVANSALSIDAGVRFYSSPWGWTGENLYISDTLTFTTNPTTPTISGSYPSSTYNNITYGTTSFGTAGSGTVYLYGGTSTAPTTQIASKTTTGNSTYQHSSLNRNTKYYYRARAKSSLGWSSYSSEISGVTRAGAKSWSVTNYTNTSITISCTTSAGGGAYAQNLQYSLDGGTTYTTGATVAAGTTAETTKSFTISGLTSGTTYTINTRVSTTAGTAVGSTLTQKTASTPTTPTVSAAADTASSNKITYGTTSFGYPASGTVYLYGGTSASPTTQIASKTTTGNSTYTHSSLTGNTKYYYRSRVYNGKLYSSYSSDVTKITKPKAPTATTSSVTNLTATLTISAPSQGAAENLGVQYRIKKSGGSYGEYISAGGTAQGTSKNVSLTGLDPGTTYYITPRLSNSSGETVGTEISFTTKSRFYVSVSGKTKLAKKVYVSVSGKTKLAKKIYASVNGKTKRVF